MSVMQVSVRSNLPGNCIFLKPASRIRNSVRLTPSQISNVKLIATLDISNETFPKGVNLIAEYKSRCKRAGYLNTFFFLLPLVYFNLVNATLRRNIYSVQLYFILLPFFTFPNGWHHFGARRRNKFIRVIGSDEIEVV